MYHFLRTYSRCFSLRMRIKLVSLTPQCTLPRSIHGLVHASSRCESAGQCVNSPLDKLTRPWNLYVHACAAHAASCFGLGLRVSFEFEIFEKCLAGLNLRCSTIPQRNTEKHLLRHSAKCDAHLVRPLCEVHDQ